MSNKLDTNVESKGIRKIYTIVAIFSGIASGILGFVPLALGVRSSKNVTKTSNFGYASIILLAFFASLAVLVVLTALCLFLARELILPFCLAEVFALCLSAIGFGVHKQVRK